MSIELLKRKAIEYFKGFDRFKNEDPDPDVISKKVLLMGLVFIPSSIFPYYFFTSSNFPIDKKLIYVWLLLQCLTGVLYIIASTGIKARRKWGKRLTQVTALLMLFLGIVFSHVFFMNMWGPNAPLISIIFEWIFTIVTSITIFSIEYYWIKFLDRLPDETSIGGEFLTKPQEILQNLPDPKSLDPAHVDNRYKYSMLKDSK